MDAKKLRPFFRRAGVIALALMPTLCPAQTSSAVSPIIGRFAGNWKEDESKRKLALAGGLRFRLTPTGGLEELRGPEAQPIVQPVNFDGKPYPVDGGNLIAWKQIDPNKFQRQIFDGRTSSGGQGKLLTTRTIQISADGKTLTEVTERGLTNGKTLVTTVTSLRTSGEAQGLAGTWKPQSFRDNMPDEMRYEPAGANGLKYSDPQGATFTVMLDGKPVPFTGPTTFSNTVVAAKQIDDRTIELTQSRGGVVLTTRKQTISADGKTMTITLLPAGANAAGPSTEVFVKQ
jgi:hypothetical protein